MRPTAWVSFLALFLLTAAVYKGLPAQARPAAPAAVGPAPSWVVQGGWRDTPEEATEDALDKARAKVTDEYLRKQNPPMEWPLDAGYLRQKLWHNDLKADEATLKALGWDEDAKDLKAQVKEQTINGHTVLVEAVPFEKLGIPGGAGKMHRAAVRVEVGPSARSEFERQEQSYQAKQRHDRSAGRQGILARVLVGVIAVLVAVACYLRLEDATKGYYTTLLRLAAVAFVVVVGAGIWLLSAWL
jgi:hypothetical protein